MGWVMADATAEMALRDAGITKWNYAKDLYEMQRQVVRVLEKFEPEKMSEPRAWPRATLSHCRDFWKDVLERSGKVRQHKSEWSEFARFVVALIRGIDPTFDDAGAR